MKRSKDIVPVSDHALLRYIERVKGFDLDVMREEIEAIIGPAAKMKARRVSADGFTYVLSQSGRLKTVLEGATPLGASLKTAQLRGGSVRIER